MRHMTTFIIIAIFGAALVTAQSATTNTNPTPAQSIHICDWGMLIIEHPAEDEAPFISIDSPQAHSGVDGNTFTVSGEGAGLFEGNVIVEVTGPMGETLLSEPTTLVTDEVGGRGAWSFDVSLDSITDVTAVRVRAYSTSPRDGSVIAQDSLQLNLNSAFGLRFIEITSPARNEAVSTTPLLIEGTGGAIFENNVTIQVLDRINGEILSETFATIETDEIAGIGPWSTTLDLPLETGASFVVHAFSLSAEDGETILADDFGFGVVTPFATRYERILVLQAGDPITMTDDLCAEPRAEFDHDDIMPIAVESLTAMETRAVNPLVNLTINAAGSSNCPLPQRIRITRDASTYTGQLYYAMSDEPVPCTLDLRPFTRRVPLGTQPDANYSVTINGVSLD